MTHSLGKIDLYGWRGRVGLILPADNVLMEPELNALRIPGVSFHGLRLTETEPEAMRRQSLELARAVHELGLDVVVYACAETSFNGGDGVRTSLADEIQRVAGVPVITATNALLAALHATGARSIALATPYSVASAEILETTIVEHGFRVTASVHRDFSLETEDPRVWYLTNRQPATRSYELAKAVENAEADTLVIVSTNWATLQIVEYLEADTGKQVLTTNQCILWWCLRQLRVQQPGLRIGALLESPTAVESTIPVGP